MAVTRIIWLDPGEKVGWATATLDHDHYVPCFPETPEHPYDVVIQTMPTLTIEKHGISHLKDMALALHRAVVLEDKYDVVGYESWRLATGKAKQLGGNDMQSSQFIGMVRLCAWLNPRVKIVDQAPAAMKTADKIIPSLYPEIHELIKKAPKSHDESHDTSALRHLAKWHWDKYVGNSKG